MIYLGSVIGERFETGHGAIVREENVIGDRVAVWSHTVIDYGCVIGNDVKIHSNVYIAQYTTLEDGVFIGPGTVLLNDPHSRLFGQPRRLSLIFLDQEATGAVQHMPARPNKLGRLIQYGRLLDDQLLQ